MTASKKRIIMMKSWRCKECKVVNLCLKASELIVRKVKQMHHK